MIYRDNYLKILNTLVKKRKEAMTEQDMANALRVSKGTILNFKANKRQNHDLLESYANIFGYMLILNIYEKKIWT